MTDTPVHYQATETNEGEGVRVRRLFPVTGLQDIDPFVLLDEFFMPPGSGFPDHGHHGFEAVTYLLEGTLRHRDSLGNDIAIATGGAAAFNAGRGIIHSQAPVGPHTAHGLQLWVNLPAMHKGAPPAFQEAAAAMLARQVIDCGEERTVIGPGSPLRLLTPVQYHDVHLERDGEYHLAVPAHHNGFLYVVGGRLEAEDTTLGEAEALVLPGGTVVTVYAERSSRFVCVAGLPHGGPIRHHGTHVD